MSDLSEHIEAGRSGRAVGLREPSSRAETPSVAPAATPQAAPALLSMGEASALLGVSTATLRRWSSDGRIASHATPGGHRRFARSTLEALLPRAPEVRAAIAHAATADRIHRAYRESALADGAPPAFLVDVPSGARGGLRTYGRIITSSILACLEAPDDESRDAALAEGLVAAAAYGRIAGTAGASMRETVAAFVRFRMPFVREMAGAARREGLDANGATDLLETVTVAIDRLLDATLEGYEQVAAAAPRTTARHLRAAAASPSVPRRPESRA